MAIPRNAKPVAIPSRGKRGGGKSTRETDYGLDRDVESQLYVLANLRAFMNQETGATPGFTLSLDEAKQIFNYPLEKDVKNVTFKTNANTSLKRRGPGWLALGHRTVSKSDDEDDEDEIEIVFKHNSKAYPRLPTVTQFCNTTGLDTDRAKEILAEIGCESILEYDDAGPEDSTPDETEEAEEEESSEDETEEAEEEEAPPIVEKKSKKANKRKRGRKKSD